MLQHWAGLIFACQAFYGAPLGRTVADASQTSAAQTGARIPSPVARICAAPETASGVEEELIRLLPRGTTTICWDDVEPPSARREN
jgi:hypothetical protein